jgi:hypothetical protein
VGEVGVFAEGDVADPVEAVLDVPLQPGPVLELVGLGVLGGQRDDEIRGLAAGFPFDRAGPGDPYCLFGMREAEPGRSAVGQRFDGAGLPPPVSFVAALVTDRHLGPGQRLEQTVQRRLVRLDRDHEVGATGGDLACVAGLGVQRVRHDDHPVKGAEQLLDPVQQRGERRDLVRLRRDLHLGQNDAGAGVIGRQQVHLTAIG